MRMNEHSSSCHGPTLDDDDRSSQLLVTRRGKRNEKRNSTTTTIDTASLDPIARLGYFIDERGEIRHVISGRHLNEEIEFEEKPQQLQKEILAALVSFIQSTLVASGPTGECQRIMVPSLEEAVHEDARCPIFCSNGWQEASKLMVLVSSSRVQAGMWSRSCCFDHGLFFGTMLPYIEAAKLHGMAVVILNPYANSITSHDSTSFVPTVHKTRVRMNETPERHVLYAWDRYIRRSSADDMYYVANGYGGVLVQHLLTERDEARARTRAIALTSSSHGWQEVEKGTAERERRDREEGGEEEMSEGKKKTRTKNKTIKQRRKQ